MCGCCSERQSDLCRGEYQIESDSIAAILTNPSSQILDFGAVRDGKPPEELGKRILLNGPEVQRLIEEEA